MTRTWAAARARNVLAPAAFFAAVVAIWQAGVFNNLLGLKTFALPLPADILTAASDAREALTGALKETVVAALLGYVLGNALGFIFALGLLRLPVGAARRAGAVGASIQALPIVATAPLVALWIADPLWYKATVVVIMAVPSMLVFAYRGFTSVDPKALELAASYDASRAQVLTTLRLPTAVPHIFTALKYTVVVALIGVVVAEILRSQAGLGFQIHDALQKFNTAEAWAAVALLALTGILTYITLVVFERVVFPWSARHGAEQ